MFLHITLDLIYETWNINNLVDIIYNIDFKIKYCMLTARFFNLIFINEEIIISNY
jgi:hypothetical protein